MSKLTEGVTSEQATQKITELLGTYLIKVDPEKKEEQENALTYTVATAYAILAIKKADLLEKALKDLKADLATKWHNADDLIPYATKENKALTKTSVYKEIIEDLKQIIKKLEALENE